jgi:hypothetical protein
MCTGSADLDRASPSANPAGSTPGGLVELKRIVVAVVFGLSLLAAPSAFGAMSGGAYASEQATITALSCVAGCAGVDAVKAGSVLRIRGTSMRDVETIVFLGTPGSADDVRAPVSAVAADAVDATVPAGAASGSTTVNSAPPPGAAPTVIVP